MKSEPAPKSSASTPSEEIVITRVFAAPPELVFAAWTQPRYLERWWGPQGFTSPVCQWDVRPGGKIHHVMRGPQGVEYPMGGEFLEIVPPERLVLRTGALAADGALMFVFQHAVTFAAEAGGTRVTLRSQLRETTPGSERYTNGFRAGMTQSLERLAEVVEGATAERPTTGQEFVLVREFAAPRDLVWQAWTQAEHLARWFGPKGFTMTKCSLDLRPGGIFHYGMKSPDGHEMWGKWLFREIVAPEKLVVIVAFSDAAAGVTRHPLSATWPLQTLSTTTFTEHAGRTTLTLRWVPYAATDEECRTFDSARGGMQQGWKGTMDQFEAYLAAIQQGA